MSAFLAYSYSTNKLTQVEKNEIDSRTKNSRSNFAKGFKQETSISFIAFSFYLIITVLPACASYVNSNLIRPGRPTPDPAVIPDARLRFKTLSQKSRSAYVGASSGICTLALQTGDFYIGSACAMLLIVGRVIMNRPRPVKEYNYKM